MNMMEIRKQENELENIKADYQREVLDTLGGLNGVLHRGVTVEELAKEMREPDEKAFWRWFCAWAAHNSRVLCERREVTTKLIEYDVYDKPTGRVYIKNTDRSYYTTR